MRAFAAVFAREIFDRRFAFAVAFLAGFVPLIGSGLYGWSSPDAAEGRVLVALVGATALSAAFAILLGGAVIVGETKEKRISFYFSRPIPSGAIWAGKLLAAIFITLATALLAFAPGWLSGTTHARSLWRDATPGNTALAALVLAVVLVLGSHAAVTVARLRSPWVVLDLLLAPTLVLLAVACLRSLSRNFGIFEFQEDLSPLPLAVALAVAPLLALLVASYAQVAEGRTDARRAHGAFSAVFFGIVAAAVAALGGYTWWCASGKATDLVEVGRSVETAPRGSWVTAGGRLSAARGFGMFLFDAARNRSVRVYGYGEVFSADGTRAAWEERRFGFFERKGNRSDLYVADLATGRAVATGLETMGWSALALSPSGRRLAIRDGGNLAAYDVSDPSNPKQVAAVSVPEGSRGIAFVDEDTVRLFPRFYDPRNLKEIAPPALEITELTLSSKKSLATGGFDRATLPFLRLSGDAKYFIGTRKLTDEAFPQYAITLHDGRTGVLLAALAADLRGPQALFLTGNRIAVAGIAGANARLLFFEGEMGWSAPARMVELGPAHHLVLGGEIAPGRVALSLLPFKESLPTSRRAAKLLAVDAATGAVSPLADGLVPTDRFAWWYSSVLPPAEAGSPASSLFLDADGRLVRLDLATGRQTVLLGKGK